MPQNADLAAHRAQLEKAVEANLPPEFDGILGFDFEGWEPVWDSYLWPGYKNVSQDLVREAHPDWSEEQITQQAALQFNAAGKEFFRSTLATVRELRPRARFGFYGMPNKLWYGRVPLLGPLSSKKGYPSDLLSRLDFSNFLTSWQSLSKHLRASKGL